MVQELRHQVLDFEHATPAECGLQPIRFLIFKRGAPRAPRGTRPAQLPLRTL